MIFITRNHVKNVLVVLIVSVNTSEGFIQAIPPEQRRNIVHCTELECEKTGQFYKDNIDPNISPCEDFYQYACGNWIKSQEIPEGVESWGHFVALGVQSKYDLREILEDKNTTDTISETKVKTLYKTCMDTDTMEINGISYLKQLIDNNGGLPLSMGNEWNSTGIDWKKIHTTYTQLTGKGALINLRVLPDLHTNKPTIHLSQPDSIHGRYMVLDLAADLHLYEKFLEDVALEFVDASRNVSVHSVRAEIKKLLEFRRRLTLLVLRGPDSFDEEDYYNPYTIEQLRIETEEIATQTHALSIDWLQFINKIFAPYSQFITIDKTERIIVRQPEYIKFIGLLLRITPKRVLVNHIHMHFVEQHLMYTNSKMRKLASDIHEYLAGIPEDPERWILCVNENQMQHVLASMYVKKHFPRSSKESMKLIAENLRHTLLHQITNSPWMDQQTKSEALIKVRAIDMQIGYPDWYDDEKKLEAYYEGQHVGNHYLLNALSYTQNEYRMELKTLRSEPTRNLTDDYPTDVNAYYYSGTNSLVCHAALLQWPIYSEPVPVGIKFATAGFILAHEMGHAFDEHGQYFDANGQPREWWKNRTKELYAEKMECLVDKYDNRTVPEAIPPLKTNGTLTLGENIADVIGVNVAYDTFAKSVNRVEFRPTFRLPFLDDYTEEQIFFIAYANVFCEALNGTLVKKLMSDTHSLSRFRINGPLSLMHEFSNAYHCDAGSPMNPNDKCKVWKM